MKTQINIKRPTLKNVMKIIRPLIMAHKGGDCFAVENSLKAVKKSINCKAEIIELDIRKSSDNILFCYHGSIPELILSWIIFKKNFNSLKMKYPHLITLRELALEIGTKAILFLDIKDKSISAEDLLESLENVKLNEVYIAHRSLKYHEKIGVLPNSWKKIINMGYIFSKSKINKMIGAGIYAIELFFWDFNNKNINLLRKNGIDVALSRLFLSAQKYFLKCVDKKTLWITGNDLTSLIKVRNNRKAFQSYH